MDEIALINQIIFYFTKISFFMHDSQSNHSSHPPHKQKTMFKTPLSYDQRHCTDVCCIVIGVAFTVILLSLSFILYRSDNLTKTSLPSDSSGKVCGIDYPNFSFVYFTNAPQINNRVCVSTCPKPGDSKLQCAPTDSIGCKFSNAPGFTVQYYDTTAVQDSNGNICMPTDEALKQKISENANLDSRSLFFKSFTVLEICLLLSIGLSFLFYVFVECFPKIAVKATIALSMLVFLGLSIALFLYKTDNTKSKIFIAIVILALFLILVTSVIAFRSAFPLSAVFLKESTKFSSKNRGSLLYIPIFLIILFGFFVMMIQEYRGFVSFGTPQFEQANLYYEVNKHGLFFTATVLIIQLIWGLSFIKEAFNFLISFHAIRFYFKKDAGICSINDAFKLLCFKHLGSVIAASFINAFLFVPDTIVDILRVFCNFSIKVLDLVRTDALAYTVLTGNPFCNSAMYCEYLSEETLLSDFSQSIMRTYRIAAHILLAGSVSIVGLYLKGTIEPYTVIATFILGIFISTFMISYNADAAEALMLMHFLQEEYYKRSDEHNKITINKQVKEDRDRFISLLHNIHQKNPEITKELVQVRQQHWNDTSAE